MVQQPYRNANTGDSVWCGGKILYPLKCRGPNSGLQIQVKWHCQPHLNQPNAPDKAERDTLELSSANPLPRVTPEKEAQRGNQIHRGNLPRM